MWLAFADGRHVRVEAHLVQKSPLLQYALELAAGTSEYLQHRERIFQWHQYATAMYVHATWDSSTSTLIILRQLLVCPYCPYLPDHM